MHEIHPPDNSEKHCSGSSGGSIDCVGGGASGGPVGIIAFGDDGVAGGRR